MTQHLIGVARGRPELSRLFSTYQRQRSPILHRRGSRQGKAAKRGGHGFFQALQVYLGGLYINDFNYLGRTWHVMAQADAPFRATVAGIAPEDT